MKRIAESFAISRTNLIVQSRLTSPKKRAVRTINDGALLTDIQNICKKRVTYGYRRVCANINRSYRKRGLNGINQKKVYRVMKENKMLLERHTGKVTRTHEGKIITLKSNLRWCSDAFEIKCWNGEKVNVVFAMDCCDREVISYLSTTPVGITSEMVCDLIVDALQYRFSGMLNTPTPIEWLSDNGSCYTAKRTREFAESVNLIPCTTPSYSPQSNGMAKAFVKTFKRDYVYVNDHSSTKYVMNRIPEWINDYNENHPHKGLKMESPREFLEINLAS